MALTKIVKNGCPKPCVRIPAELAYEPADRDVEIERVGVEIRTRPARRSLDQVQMSKFAQFSSDFMSEGRGENMEPQRDEL